MMYEGPRYVASLQDISDICRYKDFFESDKYEETKQEVDDAAARNNRSAILYDRKVMGIVYKKQIDRVVEKVVEKKEEPSKKGRKKSVDNVKSKKTITNNDYFD